MLAPDFGSDVYTWGSLISTFLVALSLGYLLGGWLSRHRPGPGVLSLIVGLSGALVLALYWIKQPVCDAIFNWDVGERLGPLLASLALFTLPAMVMGMVSPYCVRLHATGLESVGATSGSLYAVSTIGSTGGTLVTTFFLIPTIGVKSIVLWNGGVLLAMALILAAASRARGMETRLAAAMLLLLAMPAGAEETVIHARDSAYSRIIVSQEGNIRVMRFSRKGVRSEESRMDVTLPDRMLNEYTGTMMAGMLLAPDPPKDALVIGLGGGIVPRALRKYYPGTNIDVVEIDRAVVDVAREYFGFRTDPALNSIVSDGRVYVKRCRKKYDVVFLDAFQGSHIPFHLMTREFLEEVKRVLKPGGVVVANIHRGPRLHSSQRQTYRAAFPHEYPFGGNRSGNMILVTQVDGPKVSRAALLERAAKSQAQKKFVFDITAEARKYDEKAPWDTNATMLTDDYAPVETLNR